MEHGDPAEPGEFLPTPSARRATLPKVQFTLGTDISTHALREEGDSRPSPLWWPTSRFLPTPSARRATSPSPDAGRANAVFLPTPSARRATRRRHDPGGDAGKFLPTPSARRATFIVECDISDSWISTHALREEGDQSKTNTVTLIRISTHALREEGDQADALRHYGARISTHALREEGDGVTPCAYLLPVKFLPTPSARRATCSMLSCLTGQDNFYPRPPRGGRPSYGRAMGRALRFLPTPSARRATHPGDVGHLGVVISTHALREEGDLRTH